MENEKELINKNLEIIHKSKFRFSKYELVNLNGKTSHGGFIKEMITILDSYDLIIESGDYIMLSPFGKEVMTKYFGWNNYLKNKDIKLNKDNIRQNRKDWLLGINIKWKIPSIITGLLILFGTFYFGFKGINSKENKESIEYQKEQIKDTTNTKELKKEATPQTQLKDTLEFQKNESK